MTVGHNLIHRLGTESYVTKKFMMTLFNQSINQTSIAPIYSKKESYINLYGTDDGGGDDGNDDSDSKAHDDNVIILV